jgi:hypothetical protein
MRGDPDEGPEKNGTAEDNSDHEPCDGQIRENAGIALVGIILNINGSLSNGERGSWPTGNEVQVKCSG